MRQRMAFWTNDFDAAEGSVCVVSRHGVLKLDALSGRKTTPLVAMLLWDTEWTTEFYNHDDMGDMCATIHGRALRDMEILPAILDGYVEPEDMPIDDALREWIGPTDGDLKTIPLIYVIKYVHHHDGLESTFSGMGRSFCDPCNNAKGPSTTEPVRTAAGDTERFVPSPRNTRAAQRELGTPNLYCVSMSSRPHLMDKKNMQPTPRTGGRQQLHGSRLAKATPTTS
ncbi:Aste57867_15006 [Aphanomyces stellatus]|uniref:Aste57867_15006 protein n=1 Tax=Aphanomyces stellatus TaxID=120398 RepID=A0A485L342_9STRA|nr:hypothetical protein As57867_014950 [Aphanomyces stellatus]VFT91820.1 Aste57867_15006 [Aphanomyces stellatus]